MQRLLLAALLAVASLPANANWRIGAGLADEVNAAHAGVGTIGWLSRGQHPWELLGGYIGRRHEPADSVPNAYFGALSKRIAGQHWFVSSGIAYVSVDNDVLSGRFQFLTGAGYDGERWSVSLRHLSNAGTSGRNRGETFLLLEWDL